jgi:integrase
MATIRKRGSSWQAQVRRQGFPSLTKTFSTQAYAAAWARDQERAVDRAELPPDHRLLRSILVRDLLDRYEREITAKKRGADRERYKLRILRSHSIAKANLGRLTGALIAAYRDDKLCVVSSGTVRRELAVLQHCFKVARQEWGITIPVNPVEEITLPAPSKARNRRLEPEDAERFWKGVERARASWVKPFVTLAIETGMRRGELLSIRWQDVSTSTSVIRIKQTKNGHERVIPLTPLAVQTILSLPQSNERVFPIAPGAVRQAWDRLRTRAGIEDYGCTTSGTRLSQGSSSWV